MRECYNKIYVFYKENNKAILEFPDYDIKVDAYLGKNGVTKDKKEGDGKTPLGKFKLGIALGMHSKEEITKEIEMDYTQITKEMYWVDDSESKYYNKLVNISMVKNDWNSAEHLIDFPIQYEYLIEIKTNPENIPGKGSAIFLHCTNNKATEGCIAIDRENMKKLIEVINKQTEIIIQF